MKKALFAAIVLGICATASAQEQVQSPGATADDRYENASWTAKIDKDDPSRIDLDISERGPDSGGHHHNSTIGETMPLAAFTGLDRAGLNSGRPVTFELRREAGTIVFTGRFAEGVGQGRLRFISNPAYEARLRQLGFASDQNAEGRLALVMLDVSTAFIGEMQAAGINGRLNDFVAMRAVGATPALARELRPVVTGGVNGTQLVSLAAVGVTPDYARGMRGTFSSLSATQLTSLKALNVNPAQLARYRAIGLSFSADDASGLAALNVTPDYIQSIRAAGGRIENAHDAESFRALGISPDAVRRVVAHGAVRPSASEVMQLSVR